MFIDQQAIRASMGPRSNERGNYPNPNPNSKLKSLQWGHVQMNVEMGMHNRIQAPPSPASMGPRSNERGNEA